MPEDKLTKLYNSAQFLEKYGKDKREELMKVFDKMDDSNLAARRLEWCMKYSRVPRELSIPALEKFYSSRGMNESEVKEKISQGLHNTKMKDEEKYIPCDPIEEITE